MTAAETSAEDDEGEESSIVDPTSELLMQITHVESRIPWKTVGVFLLALLWLPTLGGMTARLDPAPGPESAWDGVRPGPEAAWIADVFEDRPLASHESVHVRAASRWMWSAFGVDPEAGRPLGATGRRAVRVPGAVASFLSLLLLLALGRAIAGDAGGLLAASLGAVVAPWTRVGGSALPLAVGEMLALAGVWRAVAVQARHREVEVPGISAIRIGFAGILLGLAVLWSPANGGTLVATVLFWLLLALLRTSSERTTLPVERPGATAFYGVAGMVTLGGAAVLSAWGVERLAGGTGLTFLAGPRLGLADGSALWVDLYRGLLSPGPVTDRLVLVAIPVLVLVRVVEWWAGKPWRASGLLPWVFLGLYALAFLRGAVDVGRLIVPLTVPPLFVLGIGWLVLRGLRPGRVHRQEYSFLLVWLGIALGMVPLLPARALGDPRLAACVMLLPPLLIMAGRTARAIWEMNEHLSTRVIILLLSYLPVFAFVVAAVGDLAGSGSLPGAFAATFDARIPHIVLGIVVLGILSELVTVRPDVVSVRPLQASRTRGRRGRRSGERGGEERAAGTKGGGREGEGGRRGGRGEDDRKRGRGKRRKGEKRKDRGEKREREPKDGRDKRRDEGKGERDRRRDRKEGDRDRRRDRSKKGSRRDRRSRDRDSDRDRPTPSSGRGRRRGGGRRSGGDEGKRT